MEIGDIKRARELGLTGQHKYIAAACLDCGKVRWVAVNRGRPLSKRCRHCSALCREIIRSPRPEIRAKLSRELTGRVGKDSIAWKGGSVYRGGYIAIKLTPTDFFAPMATKQLYVFEHRLVMARYLKRCLLSWEVVHHKNGIKDDNRLENLELLPAAYKHDVITQMAKHIRELEKEIARLKRKLGTVNPP